MNERISVVVPAYNCARWLPRCLDSLLAQDYEDLEIIVVDDESGDNTPEVLAEYGEKYSNIRSFRRKNGGEYAARLSGVEIARGDYIGFVDADDEVEPGMYSRLMALIREQNADIAHCGYRVIHSDGRVEDEHNTGRLRVQEGLTGVRDLLEEKVVETGLCSKLFARSLFAGLPQWMDFSIVNNGDLLMNYYLFLKAEKAVYIDISPYHYLLREGSASRKKPNGHILFDPVLAREKILDTCPEGLRGTAAQAMIRLILVSLRRIALEAPGEYEKEQAHLREILRAQKKNFCWLSAKNRLQAELACCWPWGYRQFVRCYAGICGNPFEI